MRILILVLLVLVVCPGQTCDAPPPASDDGQTDEDVLSTGPDDNVPNGEHEDANDDGQDNEDTDSPDTDGVAPGGESSVCYRGSFECCIGPTIGPCGTWEFEVNDESAITGTGTITEGFPSLPMDVTLSGLFDPNADSITVDLSSDGSGTGIINFIYDASPSGISGSWTHTDDDGPTGQAVEGTAHGSFCSAGN